MEKYDSDDAFFGIVNNNKEAINRDKNTQAEIAKFANIYARQIGERKSTDKRYAEQKKKIEKKQFIKRTVIAIGIVSSIVTAIAYSDDLAKIKNDFDDTRDATTTMVTNANLKLEGTHLTSGTRIQDNSVSDYKKLNVDSIEEVYIYMFRSNLAVSGNKNKGELYDFIRSVKYYDDDGNVFYYQSYDDFLARNNFNDEDDFINTAQNIILQRYRKGEIKQLPFEGTGTANMRGGR